MSSSPLPVWALAGNQPTKEQYLQLLRQEARRRGLIDWSETAPALEDLVDAHPFDNSPQPHSPPQTPEEWCTDTSPASFSETLLDLHTEAARQTAEDEFRDTRRAELLEEYAPLYLLQITNDVHSALHIHGASALLASIEKNHRHNTILHAYAALVKLQQTHPESSSSATQIQIYIYSDLPALPPPTLHACLIPPNTTFPTFLAWTTTLPLLRHHLTTHSPSLASSLFVPDTLLHPPGEAHLTTVGPFSNPHPSTSTYDDDDNAGPGRGWHSQVFPRPDPENKLTKEQLPARDWRALDTAADWDSLLALLRRDSALTVALLHQSVRERYAYVAERVAKEEALAREFDPDLRPFNVLREEDRERVDWEDKSLLGPGRGDGEAG